ncbi:MAG: hypothetical protein FWG99_08125 [Treponema sp.]|nr:hypothetical protein [Treponema sp.]
MEQAATSIIINKQKPPALFTNIVFPSPKIVREDLVSISVPLERSIVDADFNSITRISNGQGIISFKGPT